MRINEKSIFSFILMITMVVFVILALNYNPEARLFPLVVGSITLIMLVIQFLGDTIPAFSKRFPFLNQNGMFAARTDENENEHEINEKQLWIPVLVIISSIIGFIIFLYYTNYLIAIFVFLFSVICFIGKEKPLQAIVVSGGMTAFMFVLFDVLLNSGF